MIGNLVKIRWFILIVFLSFNLSACLVPPHNLTPAMASQLADGKRSFQAGLYKPAMRKLLPLACDGNAEAQYAVGYMYYYGYGVSLDTEVGFIWIERSARQSFQPAIEAIKMIKINKD